jgi:hypothetical protein
MSAAMPVVAIVLPRPRLVGALAKEDLALLEHGLMMPAMLIPMFLRLDLYTVARPRDSFPARDLEDTERRRAG